MKRICVFCGSNSGREQAYKNVARELALAIAARGQTLVYGGGNVGLMGVLANTALASGGRVVGVIPHQLAKLELAHEGLSELHVVADMHERKALMAKLADAVIALPGGLGTLEELFEALTWTQLGIHAKPCGLVNTLGYYDDLLAFLDKSVEEQFVRRVHRDLLVVDENPEKVLDLLESVEVPVDTKWIDEVKRTSSVY